MSENPIQPPATSQISREKAGLVALMLGAVVIAAVIILLVVIQGNAPVTLSPTAKANSSLDQLQRGTFAAINAPQIGNPQAPITLIEFSNFSCPGCAQYRAEVKEIIQKHVTTGKASLIFAPMVFQSAPSQIAAIASLCAHQQGKFWEMHDALFDIHEQRSPSAFSLDNVNQAAQALNLDMTTFAPCVEKGEPWENILKSIELANKVQIQYTPTLMYSRNGGETWEWFTAADGTRYDSRVPVEEVTRLLESVQ